MYQQNTPEQRARQAYEDWRNDQVRPHYVQPKGWTWSFLTSSAAPKRSPKGTSVLKMTFQGRLVKAQVLTKGHQPNTHKHLRKEITDFSSQSRGRLFELFNSLKLNRRATFVTLTYPTSAVNQFEAKRHLRAFFKRIERMYSGRKITGIWRMEFQERGAIHFHIMFFGLPFIHKTTIAALWSQVTHTYNPFTRIEGVSGHKKLINYVAKYVGKVNGGSEDGFNSLTYLSAYQFQQGEKIGRVWGYINKKDLPLDEKEVLELPFYFERFMQFRDSAAAIHPPILRSISFGFKIFVGSAASWLDYFHTIYDLPFTMGNRYYLT